MWYKGNTQNAQRRDAASSHIQIRYILANQKKSASGEEDRG